jgi:putative peptidoglycan lipid II flippase
MILTYACYARNDTRTPLMSMLVQAAICLGLASTALLVHGPAMLVVLGLALSVSVSAAALHLTTQMWRNLRQAGTERLAPSLARFAAGAAIMAGPAWVVADNVPHWLGRSVGARVGIVAAVLTGAAVFLSLQALWRTPEMAWLAGGLRRW